MVNVQVWWNEIQDGGKIASYSCGEKDVEQVVADFESDYGAVKHICLEDGVVYGIKGNKKYGFKLFADNHFLLIRTTEGQMERLMEKIVTDEFEDRIVDGYHCKGSYDRKTEGSETMTENMGYDRDIVLLETGEFKCGSSTFTYEGDPITVGDVLDGETTFFNFKTAEGDNGSFHITETHHIMLMVHSFSELGRFSVNYDEIVYAPRFEEIYETASDFIEVMVGIANRYYDPKGEIRERVEYSSFKGRLLKDLVEMSEEELVAIDNEEPSAEIPISDVEAYVEYLKEEAQKPSTWMVGVTITEELIDYHIRHKIEWGIDNCEKYCSPSVEFFRLAQAVYEGAGESAPLNNKHIEDCIALCKKELEVESFFMSADHGHTINGEFLDSLRDEIVHTLVSIYAKLCRENISRKSKVTIDGVYARITEHWKLQREGTDAFRCIGFRECAELLNTLEGVYLHP